MRGTQRKDNSGDTTHRTPYARSSCLVSRALATWHTCTDTGQQEMLRRLKVQHSLPCPLPSRCRVPLRVVLVQVSDVGHKRVIGIRVSEH